MRKESSMGLSDVGRRQDEVYGDDDDDDDEDKMIIIFL